MIATVRKERISIGRNWTKWRYYHPIENLPQEVLENEVDFWKASTWGTQKKVAWVTDGEKKTLQDGGIRSNWPNSGYSYQGNFPQEEIPDWCPMAHKSCEIMKVSIIGATWAIKIVQEKCDLGGGDGTDCYIAEIFGNISLEEAKEKIKKETGYTFS